MTPSLRISLVQTDIIWENKQENLHRTESKIQLLQGSTDLVVLPEMFTTGFSMQSHLLAESVFGPTITSIKNWAKSYDIAISGSFICVEDDRYYNRAFFITAENEYYYDKRHLFRMGEESLHFESGNKRCIFNYKGWNICLAVCYDLRFPVWLRNVDNEYDLLLIVANWPSSRRHVWEVLLNARALENQSYVCGVNRIGMDGKRLSYSGQSVLLNAKGQPLSHIHDGEEKTETVIIDMDSLLDFRDKFPVWKDADDFTISF